MYTLIETAKLNGLDPEAYLRHASPITRSTESTSCSLGRGKPSQIKWQHEFRA
jgi:hypothetical protein